jgi:hypothetical protein
VTHIILKGGRAATDPRLDRVPEYDEASRAFPVRTLLARASVSKPRSYSWACDTWLDQGKQGACVGHGWAHEIAAKPVPLPAVEDLAMSLYHRAQQLDDFPGEAYSGTSVLAGAKAATELGYYGEYRWAFSLEDAILALGYHGPLVIGVNWWTGMTDPNPDGLLHVTGQVEGGHCILVKACKVVWLPGSGRASFADVDPQLSTVTLHNSWGRDWGVNGEARLTLADFDRLRTDAGEVCVPTVRLHP